MAGLTFVFTDIEGSTQLVRDLGGSYALALRVYRRMLETGFAEHEGNMIGSEGDGLFFVFPNAERAVTAAIEAQRKVDNYDWPEDMRMRVRMGAHAGPVTVSGGEYVGLTIHEVARVCAAAHGGQILCSSAVARELGGKLSDGELRELGVYALRGFPEPSPLFQVCADGLEDDFPPPREALRDGGAHVSIWRRGDDAPEPPANPLALPIRPLAADTTVEIRRASSGLAGAFRLVVSHGGTVAEEFDGLTIGGSADAATTVNAHSRLIRID